MDTHKRESPTDFLMHTQKRDFEKFCLESFINSDFKGQGSKTVRRAKGKKFVSVLKKDHVAEEYSLKFKHWVKQRNFHLVISSALELPAKSEVSIV